MQGDGQCDPPDPRLPQRFPEGKPVFGFSLGLDAAVLALKIVNDIEIEAGGNGAEEFLLYFLGGIQILCLGVLGEYMGKIYSEVKRRPRYIISDTINP